MELTTVAFGNGLEMRGLNGRSKSHCHTHTWKGLVYGRVYLRTRDRKSHVFFIHSKDYRLCFGPMVNEQVDVIETERSVFKGLDE